MNDISRTLRDVTLRQLRTFRTVAQRGNISAAARELHLTQPAVSMQLKELEASCGLPLYERVGRGIQLTAAGEEVAAAAASVLETLAGAQQALDAMRGLRTGRLRLAVVSTAKYFAPAILAAFAEAHPGISVQMSVGNRAEVIERLVANRCDLAIMGRPPTEVECSGDVFASHPQVIIAPPRHRLAGAAALEPRELRDETFLLRERGSGTRAAMEAFLDDAAVVYRSGMEASSNETIKQAVIAGMGLAFISAHTIALELATGRLAVLDIRGTPVVRAWHVLYRRGKRLSPAARAFSHFCRSHGADCIARALALPDALANAGVAGAAAASSDGRP
jgi:LysR family transcriptional regulator for metE and metH